ncbi:probable carbohydrate esterase at4g34215 [Phtheirospermum japonicum]|uniref:Probable carbohydrate esterase at4g34215 n=1 Tax=Phtheirospermum japonicum TaxID=374723 RepID=A0A830BK48_9LAMI|nr:probable carbohydrate esterase at4g34215 [Phtheirospermum japonicum]
MAGRGGVFNKVWNGVVPPECQPNPRILRLNAGLTWEEARDPLHHDIDNKTCGVGPGMSFANSVLMTDPSIGVIGLVPCAVGGTKISQWRPNDYLYNNTLSRAQAALRNSGGGQIRAVLWFQGESDTVDKADADAYTSRWETLFTQLRSDLQLPNLPVIEDKKEGEVGKYLKEVRDAQMAMNVPNVKYVDSMGLELNGDNVHLSTDGEVKLGKMLADAFLWF